MGKRGWLAPAALVLGTAAVWPWRHLLTAGTIAAWSPRQALPAAAFLIALYGAKSLSVAFPLSVLEAAGGLLFPLPAALAVNLLGVGVAQAVPFFLGRRERGRPDVLLTRRPGLASLSRISTERPGRTVFLLRLGGASPGDLVSLYLGAAGVPWRAYLVPGLLGSLPRVAAATVLGSALWDIGGRRFWLSLGAGAALTTAALVLWAVSRRR